MTAPAIVLACGGLKGPVPAAALDLYTGPLFASARTWALSLAPRDRIWILSAAHGLIASDLVIAPYDARARSAAALVEVIQLPAALAGRPVYFVGGAEYFEALRRWIPGAVSLAATLPPGRATRGIGPNGAGWPGTLAAGPADQLADVGGAVGPPAHQEAPGGANAHHRSLGTVPGRRPPGAQLAAPPAGPGQAGKGPSGPVGQGGREPRAPGLAPAGARPGARVACSRTDCKAPRREKAQGLL